MRKQILTLLTIALMATSQTAIAMETNDRQKATLDDVPTEVKQHVIFPFLNGKDLGRLRRVNKELKELVDAYFQTNPIIIPEEISVDVEMFKNLLAFIGSKDINIRFEFSDKIIDKDELRDELKNFRTKENFFFLYVNKFKRDQRSIKEFHSFDTSHISIRNYFSHHLYSMLEPPQPKLPSPCNKESMDSATREFKRP